MAETRYSRRIAQGFCGSCGKEPLAPGESLGPVCKAKAAVKSAARRAKQRAAGKCYGVNCDNIPTQGTWCDVCKVRNKANREALRARKEAAGICVQTGCPEPAKPHRKLCQKHITMRSVNTSRHYRKQREAGRCGYIGCKRPPSNEDGAFCAVHLEFHRQKRIQLKRDACIAYGGERCSWPGCNVDDLALLDIDHVDCNGAAHRKEIGVRGGLEFYQWLKNNDYPTTPRLRVLCANHNRKALSDAREAARSARYTAEHETHTKENQ